MLTSVRKRELFREFVLAQKACGKLTRLKSAADAAVRSWITGRNVPAITRKSICRCAVYLRTTPSEVLRHLTGGECIETEICRARGRIQRSADGTRPVICMDCGITHNVKANNINRCADCRKRHIATVKSNYRASLKARGVVRPYVHDKSRQIMRGFRRQLRQINRELSSIEREMKNDLRLAYHRKYVSERLSERHMRTLRLSADRDRRNRKRRRSLDPSTKYGNARKWVFDIMRAFNYCCAYCHRTRAESKAEGFDLQIDHIHPLGSPYCRSGPDNAAPVCIHCNSSKGKRDLMEWASSKNLSPHPDAVRKYNNIRTNDDKSKFICEA